ncbi:hypothetical protein [Rhizorhabdus sp.]|uniref:hypothetical protein n=1 Tax=Rhizorhabdus sp. TaxID=1968843 RepID=UPI0035B4B911
MHRSFVRFIAAMALVALVNCSTMNVAPPPPPPPVDGGSGQVAATAVVVREMLPRGTAFSQTASSYPFRAVILLTNRNGSRNKKLCKAYMGLLTTPDIARQVVPGAQPIPTYWPVKAPISASDCASMLAAYDYEAAKALLQVYGVADAKGPVFIVADENNRYAFIDLSKASEAQMRAVVTGWYAGVVQNGLKNTTFTSPNFFEVFGKGICGLTGNLVAQQIPPEGSDLDDPKTWGWDGQKWTKPSVLSIGAMLFGGTITNTVCGLVARIA